MTPKVYIFLANGFETTEALTVLDILKRGKVDVKTVSITGEEWVTSSHNVTVKADEMFENTCFDNADMLLLPGGLPGSTHLKEHKGLANVLLNHAEQGKKIGAICAAPMVLGALNILNGCKATCYPGFNNELKGAEYTTQLVTTHNNIVTGKGPAATFAYAFTILEMLQGAEIANQVKGDMLYNELF